MRKVQKGELIKEFSNDRKTNVYFVINWKINTDSYQDILSIWSTNVLSNHTPTSGKFLGTVEVRYSEF